MAFSSPLPLGRKETFSRNALASKFLSARHLRVQSEDHGRITSITMQTHAISSLGNNLASTSSQSWKFPRWYSLQLSANHGPLDGDQNQRVMYEEDVPALVPSSGSPPPKRIIALKVLCASLLLANVSLAWGLYFSFTNISQKNGDETVDTGFRSPRQIRTGCSTASIWRLTHRKI